MGRHRKDFDDHAETDILATVVEENEDMRLAEEAIAMRWPSTESGPFSLKSHDYQPMHTAAVTAPIKRSAPRTAGKAPPVKKGVTAPLRTFDDDGAVRKEVEAKLARPAKLAATHEQRAAQERSGKPRPAWVWVGLGVLLVLVGLALAVWITSVNAGVCKAEPDTNPATTPPLPPLPTYIVNGDGSRMDCTPNYQYCWPEHMGLS